MVAARIVGIDLGTTNSAVAVWEDGAVRVLANELGDKLTPSAVAEDPASKAIVVGRVAKDMLALNPACGVMSFKRWMGQDKTLAAGGRTFRPEELSAYVLDALKATVERELGGVSGCVVSVPAYFGEAQRAATRKAAEMAGWVVERMVNEPTAAALAYGVASHDAAMDHGDGASQTGNLVVLDLGGGTFDVCVMSRFEGLLEVRGVAGVSQLGGDDFTRVLAEACAARAGIGRGLDELGGPQRAKLLMRAELLKRKLARWTEAEIAVPTTSASPRRGVDPAGGADLGEPAVSLRFTRAEADALFAPLFAQMVMPCRQALRGANLAASDLDDVLLVGGASAWPSFATFAVELFGRPPRIEANPELLVVQGAAMQAHLCSDAASITDVVVTDVLSHSLGTEVSRRIGGHIVDGFFSPIIHRNTVIPTSKTETYYPVNDEQRVIEVGVYEGDSRLVADNTRLGALRVPLPKRGDREVHVTFTYDVSGTLDVEATVGTTGAKTQQTFARDTSLSPEEAERAMARIRQLKADPRARPRYREALARAELLWREGDPEIRVTIDAALAAFEAALAGGDGNEMEERYRALTALCQKMDGDERW